MSQIGHLLFPACIKQTSILEFEKNTNCFSKTPQHIITALVLAIILAGGAATAAYFLSQGSILYTAIAGGGGVAFLFIVGYVALRCIFGRPKVVVQKRDPIKLPPTPKKKSVPITYERKREEKKKDLSSSNPLSLSLSFTLEDFEDTETKRSSAKKELFKATPTSSDFPIDLDGFTYEVKKCVPVTHGNLLGIMKEITSEKFTTEAKNKGIAYYDPTNEMYIPFARLYQVLLADPRTESKREILMQLFADALLEEYKAAKEGFKEAVVYQYVRYLDQTLVREIGGKVVAKSDLATFNLQGLLKGYAERKEECKKLIKDYSELMKAMDPMSFAIGASSPGGGCYFHTLAQLLTQVLGATITEKQLREQCLKYLNKEGNTLLVQMTSGIEPERVRWSSREVLYGEKKEGKPSNPELGEQKIYGQIIADLYGVSILTHTVIQTEEKLTPFEEEGFEFISSATTTISHEYETGIIAPLKKGRITLNDLGDTTTPTAKEGTMINIGSVGRGKTLHMFPIFVLK